MPQQKTSTVDITVLEPTVLTSESSNTKSQQKLHKKCATNIIWLLQQILLNIVIRKSVSCDFDRSVMPVGITFRLTLWKALSSFVLGALAVGVALSITAHDPHGYFNNYTRLVLSYLIGCWLCFSYFELEIFL